jgi:hypothetical protein
MRQSIAAMSDNSLTNAQSDSSSKVGGSSLVSIVPSGFQSFLKSSATESSKSELLLYLDEANVPVEDENLHLMDQAQLKLCLAWICVHHVPGPW